MAAAAAALRRMLLPTISRPFAPRQTLSSFTGAGATKAVQGHRRAADRCMIRSYRRGAARHGEQEKKLTLKQEVGAQLALIITMWSIYGASLAIPYYWSPVQYEHDFPEDDD